MRAVDRKKDNIANLERIWTEKMECESIRDTGDRKCEKNEMNREKTIYNLKENMHRCEHISLDT